MVVPPSSTWKWTEMMQRIEDASKMLSHPYDTTLDLVQRLDVLNHLLRGVDQKLSPAMELAVKFPMEALVADELLVNDDINVKISLGCCICEVARITAPEPPYQDNTMRDVCNLLMTILESLSFVTGNAYTKAGLVLENVARCQLFMVMWDCDDAFIAKMFQTFFHLSGTNHPDSVISDMKHIITLAIKEDADVPNDLFRILLHSLKRENKNVYPVSFELAERVLQDCESELKHCLQRAMISDADFQHYSELVEKVLSDAEGDGIGKCSPSTIASKVIQEELVSEQVSAFRKPSLTEESLKHNRSTKLLRACDQIRQEKVIETTCSQRENSDAVNIVFEMAKTEEVPASKEPQESVRESLDTQIVTTSRKRGRRPNSLLKPEEGYGIHGDTGSSDVRRRRRNKRKEIYDPSEGSISKNISSTSRTAVETPVGMQIQNIPKKRRNKKEKQRDAEDISNDIGNLQVSTILSKEVMRTTPAIENGMCSDHNIEAESNGCKGSPLNRNGSSIQKVGEQRSGSTSDPSGKKSLLKILASLETPEEPSDFDKVIEEIKAKTKKKCTRRKDGFAWAEFKKDNDARLVGHKIKVYWPLDETFYAGSIISFDVLAKKHKIMYDDGEEELLDLSCEKWELVGGDISSDNDQGKVADVVMLPDTSKNAAGSSVPLIKKHKVLKDAGGDHASTSSGQRHKVLSRSKSKKLSSDVGGKHAATSTGQRQKVQKRRSKLEHHPKNVNGEHSSTSRGKGQKSLKSRIKLEQASEDLGRGQISNSNDQMLKVLENGSKLDQDQSTEIIIAATVNSPSSKLQGMTQSKRTKEKLQKSPVTPSDSCHIQVSAGSSGTVNLHGYQVKSSTAPILNAIVTKYGDIAANCLYKSPSFRASLLEVVCNVVQRLKDPVITASDIQSMVSEISDAENAKIDVSWLQKYLLEIASEEEAARKISGVRTSTCLIVEVAGRDLKLRQEELVVAQTNFKEAEKRFEVLKHVLGRIDSGILESVAKEKSWQRRLDELLSPK